MTVSARDRLVAYALLGGIFMEQARARAEAAQPVKPSEPTSVDLAYRAGMDHASNGGKLKENPHPGGSADWWGWNDGYKASKALTAEKERRARGV